MSPRSPPPSPHRPGRESAATPHRAHERGGVCSRDRAAAGPVHRGAVGTAERSPPPLSSTKSPGNRCAWPARRKREKRASVLDVIQCFRTICRSSSATSVSGGSMASPARRSTRCRVLLELLHHAADGRAQAGAIHLRRSHAASERRSSPTWHLRSCNCRSSSMAIAGSWRQDFARDLQAHQEPIKLCNGPSWKFAAIVAVLPPARAALRTGTGPSAATHREAVFEPAAMHHRHPRENVRPQHDGTQRKGALV